MPVTFTATERKDSRLPDKSSVIRHYVLEPVVRQDPAGL